MGKIAVIDTETTWGYGVESILRMLSGDCGYCEVHNAICDAMDELTIMRLLGHSIDAYGEI